MRDDGTPGISPFRRPFGRGRGCGASRFRLDASEREVVAPWGGECGMFEVWVSPYPSSLSKSTGCSIIVGACNNQVSHLLGKHKFRTSLNNMIESMFMFIFRTVSVLMTVRMVMVMVIVSMIMMVRVPMSMAMRMSMVRVTTHCHHAEQIDEQSHSTDQKKLIGVHLWWIQPKVSYISPHHASWTVVPLCSQALYGFKYDEN